MKIENIKKQIKSVLQNDSDKLIEFNKEQLIEFLEKKINLNISFAETELSKVTNGEMNNLSDYNRMKIPINSGKFINLLLENNLLFKNLIDLNKINE